MSRWWRFWLCIMALIFALATPFRAIGGDKDIAVGARKIAARIDAILATQDPLSAGFRNIERAEALKQLVARLEKEAPNSPNHLSALFSLALELLRAGDLEDSLD